MNRQSIIHLFNNKIFVIKPNKIELICKLSNNQFKYYEYIDNKNELITIIDKNLIIYNNEGKIVLNIEHNISNVYNILDIIKNNEKYYILTKTNIIVLNKELEFKKYDLPICINFSHYARKYVKLIFNNDKLHYMYYTGKKINDFESKIYFNIVEIELEEKKFYHKIISEYIVSSNSFDEEKYYLLNIYTYKNYVMYGVVNYDYNKKHPIFQYNLDNKILKKKYISYRIIAMSIIDNKLIIKTSNSNTNFSNNYFLLYDIKSFNYENYLVLDEIPPNGYYNVFYYNDKLYILTNKYKSNSNEMLFSYKKKVSLKDIKLGALALKHVFKNKLDIEYGCHTDVKELILEKMKGITTLDNEDRVSFCKITDNNYYLDNKIELIY